MSCIHVNPMMARHTWRVYRSSGKNTQKSECVYRDGHTLRGHFSIGTIGPRESVLCSQRSSDVIHVQSLWECVKYRDKGKNNRGPRRVWSFTNACIDAHHSVARK